MDCIWVNLKNVGPPFFKFMSVYIKISFTQRENHSQLFCGLDFANERARVGYEVLLYGSVSQGLGTTKFANLIG